MLLETSTFHNPCTAPIPRLTSYMGRPFLFSTSMLPSVPVKRDMLRALRKCPSLAIAWSSSESPVDEPWRFCRNGIGILACAQKGLLKFAVRWIDFHLLSCFPFWAHIDENDGERLTVATPTCPKLSTPKTERSLRYEGARVGGGVLGCVEEKGYWGGLDDGR